MRPELVQERDQLQAIRYRGLRSKYGLRPVKADRDLAAVFRQERRGTNKLVELNARRA